MLGETAGWRRVVLVGLGWHWGGGGRVGDRTEADVRGNPLGRGLTLLSLLITLHRSGHVFKCALRATKWARCPRAWQGSVFWNTLCCEGFIFGNETRWRTWRGGGVERKGKLTNYQVCLTGSHDGKLFCHVKLEGLKWSEGLQVWRRVSM